MTGEVVRATQIAHLVALAGRAVANRPPVVHDGRLLREIVARIEALAPGDRDARSAVARLRDQLASADAAAAVPLPPAELVGVLAARANQQFASYSRHFAGRARLTRRPALAARLEASLGAVLADMRRLAETYADENLTANISLVAARHAQAQDEGRAIALERAACSRDELIRLLGSELNTELVAYRKQRTQLAPPELAPVCDRVGELAWQLQELADETDDSVILATLRLATRELAQLEAEYTARTATDKHLTIADVATHAPAWRAQLACATTSEERRRDAIARLDALLDDPLVRQLVVDARSSRT